MFVVVADGTFQLTFGKDNGAHIPQNLKKCVVNSIKPHTFRTAIRL